METPRNFRSAFHGFNREDVVHYLEYINARHQSQLGELNAELEELRSSQAGPADEDLRFQLEVLQERCETLAAQLEAAEAENAQLKAQCETVEDQPAPAETSENAELESYRRAEKTEREAKERAELTYFQATSVLNEATAKVDAAAAEITAMSDAAMSQLTQLQVAVSGSKHALQDAAAIIATIRPNK